MGMIFAVVLVYLLMAVNFQSWLDPFIILMALPGALAGIVWMLFITQTSFSVPSLMGTIMCIGVATANSILMVVFANDERLEGLDARSAALSAGHTRIRPVLMTALAMIIGMLPMALGFGEGGEQNAPLGRAVIGGSVAGYGHHAVRGPDRLQLAEEETAGRFRPEDRRGGAGEYRRRTPAGLTTKIGTRRTRRRPGGLPHTKMEYKVAEDTEARLRAEIEDLKRKLAGAAAADRAAARVCRRPPPPSRRSLWLLALVLVVLIVAGFLKGYIPHRRNEAIAGGGSRHRIQGIAHGYRGRRGTIRCHRYAGSPRQHPGAH